MSKMNRANLYDAAFRYKKAGLWKKLWDNEIFAVRLKNGKIGYICIMGKNGEYNAIGLYIGEKGFASYRRMQNIEETTGSPFKDHELYLQQDCLQAAFENKEYLMPEEVKEVSVYAKKNDIKLSGKNAYPQFIKYEPGYHPWKVKTQDDMESLHTAIIASTLLAEKLKATAPELLGIVPVNPKTKVVPIFEIVDDKLESAGLVMLPGDAKDSYRYVKAENQIALATVKKLPQKGIWEAELLCLFEPVQNDPKDTPYYPMLLMIVESKSGFMLHVPMFSRDEIDHPERMLQGFAQAWKNQKVYPQELRCRDERTYAILKDFCEKTNVKVRIYKRSMAALNEAQMAFYGHLHGFDDDNEMVQDQMDEMINTIMIMDREDLKTMPKSLVEQLRTMISDGVFPYKIAEELKKKLKGL